MSTNNSILRRYPQRTRPLTAVNAGQKEKAGEVKRGPGVAGPQTVVTQGKEVNPPTNQELGRPGSDTPEIPATREAPGALDDKESSELTEEPSQSPDSSPSREGMEPAPRRRARVESVLPSDSEDESPSAGHTKSVEEAREDRNADDSNRIECRYNDKRHDTSAAAEESESGPAKGVSESKGKGIDPRNWGNVQLDADEANPEVQQQILDSYTREGKKALKTNIPNAAAEQLKKEKERRTARMMEALLQASREIEEKEKARAARKGREYATPKEFNRGAKELMEQLAKQGMVESEDSDEEMASKEDEQKPKRRDNKKKNSRTNAMKPTAQITGDSALGQAFKRMRNLNESDPSDDSSSSEDSDSSNDNYSDRSESKLSSRDSSDSSSGESHRGRSHKRRANHHKSTKHSRRAKRSRRRRRSRRSSSNERINPMPPNTYDGTAEVQQFMQFMSNCTLYLKHGRVSSRRQVLVISQFLKGRAWRFYSREVSLDPESWSIDKFFQELFNDCFPVNFRNQQRNKLNNYHQGKQSVRDYVSGLEELFTIVGYISKREKIVKFFNGFRTSVRKELYKKGLTPETSKWNRILEEAEFVERSEMVEIDDNPNRESHHHKSKHYKPSINHENKNREENGKAERQGNSKKYKHQKRKHVSIGKPTNATSGNFYPKEKGAGSSVGKDNQANSKNKRTLSKEEEEEY
ncbi:hypothetical protein C0993_002047 [Termitomyces sp. T159_Od127]|nr:hypothetical protein C0993_002047 [Termitomyces sp. T159_Od127]